MTHTPSPKERAAYDQASVRYQNRVNKAFERYESEVAKAQALMDKAQRDYESAKSAALAKFHQDEDAIYDRFNPR